MHKIISANCISLTFYVNFRVTSFSLSSCSQINRENKFNSSLKPLEIMSALCICASEITIYFCLNLMWSSSYKHTHIQSLLSGYGKNTMRACSEKLTWSLDLNFSNHITLLKMQQMERTKVKNFKHARRFSGCCSPTSL